MHRTPLPRPLDNEPFRVATALKKGVAYERLFAADLERPHHGLRSPRAAADLTARCREMLPLLRPGHCFSHLTAAALWGLPLPEATRHDQLHVLTPERRSMRRPAVVGHSCDRAPPRIVVNGVPLVEPITAWLQCAALLDLEDVVALGDALAGSWSKNSLARGRPLDELHAAVAGWGNRRGARRLQEALPLIRDRVWSPKETALRLAIVRAGLPEPPERNAEVTTAAGEVLGHADLVYRRERLAIEYEGDGHRTDRDQWRRDVARYERFQDAGWRVLRVTADDLGDTRILLDRISRHLGIPTPRHPGPEPLP